MSAPRILCLIPHFFGRSGFEGGSSDLANKVPRQAIVERTIRRVRRLEPAFQVDVLVYGNRNAALVPIDVEIADDAPYLLWRAFADTRHRIDKYDYFLFIEDDLLIPRSAIRRMMAAEKDLGTDEIIFPNRIEFVAGLPLAVDLIYLPEWTGYRRRWANRTWREATLPHSGMCFLSRRQLARVYEAEDFTKPRRSERGHFMAGAFEAAHRRFRLLRERPIVPTHFVVHQDSWLRRNRVAPTTALWRQLRFAFGRNDLNVRPPA